MAKHTSDVTESGAVEAPDLESAAAEAPRHGFFVRLYTGTGAFEVIGRRKLWYTISGLIVAVAIASILIARVHLRHRLRGRHQGVACRSAARRHGHHRSRSRTCSAKTLGKTPESVVVVGSGGSATVQIRSETLTNEETEAAAHRAVRRVPAQGRRRPAQQAGDQRLGGLGDLGRPDHPEGAHRAGRVPGAGRHLHHRALRAVHGDLGAGDAGLRPGHHRGRVLARRLRGHAGDGDRSADDSRASRCTTPSIVFDKVEENTDGFEHTTRRTFAEQANLAVNQTFMRSINTSLISVLPILALMVIAVWLLGRRHADGPRAGAAGRRHRRYVLVDLLRHPAAGDPCASAPSSCARTPAACSTGASRPPRRPPRSRSPPRRRAATSLRRSAPPRGPPRPRLPEKPAPGARPVRPTSSRTGRPSGKRNTRRR